MLIDIKDYELRELLDWHKDEELSCAENADYISARDHQLRRKELICFADIEFRKLLNKHEGVKNGSDKA